ncbi:MAG: TonB-dependent receptor [Arenicellales bacterium]|nr:TonB-dependent receptor [Arenicellales bacterium]
MKRQIFPAISAFLAFILAVNNAWPADPVVVTATRTAHTADQVLAPVSVITREDIESSEARDLGELLASQPSLQVTRNGGYGKNTSVFMRGTNFGHVLTLVDGVKLYSATLGATAFQFLPLGQIERIEIVRGPRSSLYGSEAVGGVIQIFTRRGGETSRTYANAGYGTYNTIEAAAGVSGPLGKSRFSLNVSLLDTDGIDSTSGAQSDKDGYENSAISASWRNNDDDIGELDFSLMYATGNTGFDNPFAGPDVMHDSDYLQQMLNLRWLYRGKQGWNSTLQIGQSQDDSETFSDRVLDGRFDTTHDQVNWQLDWPMANVHLLTVGLDYADDTIDTLVAYDVSNRSNLGLFSQWQGAYGRQNVVAGLRYDDNEQFGSHTTGSLDFAVDLAAGFRLNAGYGTAFKAPSFNDLYYPGFGNADLEIESSSSAELGLTGGASDGRWSLRVFQTSIDDLIGFDPVTYAPENVDEAAIDGFEAEWTGRWSHWNMLASASLIDPQDKKTGNQLPRRAREVGKITANRRTGPWGFGVSGQYQGKRYDDKANTTLLDSYALLNGHLSYQLSTDWRVKGEISNLLDESYTTAQGYQEPGRTLFLRLIFH